MNRPVLEPDSGSEEDDINDQLSLQTTKEGLDHDNLQPTEFSEEKHCNQWQHENDQKKDNSEECYDDEKDEADITPQKQAEDIELEVLLRNEQNMILNSLFYYNNNETGIENNQVCSNEVEYPEQTSIYKDKDQRFIVDFIEDEAEKGVCEYKDISLSINNLRLNNNQSDNSVRRVDSFEDKLHRINTELLNGELYTNNQRVYERIGSPSSDDSSSTVEGAAGGIPYNLILKEKWNRKQKKKLNTSADYQLHNIAKQNINRSQDRSEYLKSPSSDTSDEDLHYQKSLLLAAESCGMNPDQVYELNDQINRRLKQGDGQLENGHQQNDIRSGYTSSSILNRRTIQNRRHHNNSNTFNSANTQFVCSNYDNRNSRQHDSNHSNRRQPNRRDSHDRQNQNHYVSGGARPKKL